MPDSDSVPALTIDAAHAAIAGVQTSLDALGARLDRLVDAQGETLAQVMRLHPIGAAETEVQAALDAVDPAIVGHDPPIAAPNDPTGSTSPLRRFHEVLG